MPSSFGCLDVKCQNNVHPLERDSHVLDVLCKIVETSFECILISECVSKNKKRVAKLYGWKENVLPYKNDSLFWHSIWLSMGRPKSGGVFDVMKHTRNKFHYAVRLAKRQTDRLKSQALGEAAAKNNFALFKEMKKCLFNKNNCQQEVSDSEWDQTDSLEGQGKIFLILPIIFYRLNNN